MASKRRHIPVAHGRELPAVDVAGLADLRKADQHFVLEYLSNGYNATAAFARAHPNVTRASAAVEGWKLLRTPKIAAVLKREEARRWKTLEMNGEEAVALISAAARADIAEAFDDAGNMLPVRQWPKRLRMAVKSLKDGQVTLHDALRARQLMAQMAGRLAGDGTTALGQGLASLAKVLLGAFDPEEDRE
jgi:phage terminase small subunit